MIIKIIYDICVIIHLNQNITTETAPTTSPPPLSTCESLDGMHHREEPVQRQQQEGVHAARWRRRSRRSGTGPSDTTPGLGGKEGLDNF